MLPGRTVDSIRSNHEEIIKVPKSFRGLAYPGPDLCVLISFGIWQFLLLSVQHFHPLCDTYSLSSPLGKLSLRGPWGQSGPRSVLLPSSHQSAFTKASGFGWPVQEFGWSCTSHCGLFASLRVKTLCLRCEIMVVLLWWPPGALFSAA